MSLLLAAHVSFGFATSSPPALLDACKKAWAHLELPAEATDRAAGYVSELLRYNERTNVYSKSAYEKLPFHVADSLTLASHIRYRAGTDEPIKGILDLGSGSGLPSVLMACVHADTPVYAVESKSRKTRFLTHAARELGLSQYVALTQNVHELARSWAFDVDFVTAKAFKPLREVGPIGRRCLLHDAHMLIPISEAQVREFELDDAALHRAGKDFIYYSEALEPSHGTAQRKVISVEEARGARL